MKYSSSCELGDPEMVLVFFCVSGKAVQDAAAIIDLCETRTDEEDGETVLLLETSHMVAHLLDLQLLSLSFLAGQQNPLQLSVDEQIFFHIFFVLAKVVPIAHDHLRQSVLITELSEREMFECSQFEDWVVGKLLNCCRMYLLKDVLFDASFLQLPTCLGEIREDTCLI